ncbi:U3 small nucleolar RNA-associated protein 5 [Diplocarpon rosae]|nr:U3 small nucleolar RNA-associated protein 5 [Diplocarpon rosae]
MATKRKQPMKMGLPSVKKSAKPLGKSIVDESRTTVSGGGYASITEKERVANVSRDSDSDAESDAQPAVEDVAMEDAQPANNEEEEDQAEPSFGDRIQALNEDIDVAAAFPSHQLTHPAGAVIPPQSGASLGVVLAQALKTNDVALLESCLVTTDLHTIRATIQRLDSALAGILLQKIADRLFKRPGRAGSLMVWVQWTAVTHGGYLATQRELIRRLAELDRVVDGRSAALRPVLALKGKLDMMGAQVEYRRSVQDQRRREDEDDADEDVIYVEESDAEVQDLDAVDMDSEASDDMPATNGVDSDLDDDSSDEAALVDVQAEETGADSGDEEELSLDDDSRDEDDENDSDAGPPAKLPRTNPAFSKKR